MNSCIVIATKEELPLVGLLALDHQLPVIITGVGATTVIYALKDLPKDTMIYNIGYAGCPDVPIGTIVEIGKAKLFHKVDYNEQTFDIGDGMTCYTTTDFVTDGASPGCVYDMELAIICALGFRYVKSCKVISDNCNYSQYKKTIKCLKK